MLKEKYPSSFESFRATFGNVTISWSKDATYTVNQKPFDSDDPEHGPAIMIYIPEKEIRKFIRRNNIEVMPKVCPMDGKSKREDMKILISDFEKQIPTIRANLVGAIKRGNINGWKE